jgi:hypothetical protein
MEGLLRAGGPPNNSSRRTRKKYALLYKTAMANVAMESEQEKMLFEEGEARARTDPAVPRP